MRYIKNRLTHKEMSEMEALKAQNAELQAEVELLSSRLVQINEQVTEVVKKGNNELPSGDYLNPIPFTAGMTVEAGKFYYLESDPETLELPHEASQNGVAQDFDDKDWFIYF